MLYNIFLSGATLEEEFYFYKQFINLIRMENEKTKSGLCFDAFKKLLVDKATGDSNILNTTKRDYLLKLAKEKGYPLKAAFNNVRDKFYNGTTMTNDKFQYFGELLFEHATLTDKNSSTLRTIFPNDLFDIDTNFSSPKNKCVLTA